LLLFKVAAVAAAAAGARVGALEITAANKHLLQSAYTSRRQEELAVLTRCCHSARCSAC